MKIVETIKEVREQVKDWKMQGLTVGLVPTMGYLHEGHQSLMEAARKDNDKVVVSIFVNPMQFGPTEDLAQYPRDLEHDAALCEKTGVDLIFHPEPEEMYEKDREKSGSSRCGSGTCCIRCRLWTGQRQ